MDEELKNQIKDELKGELKDELKNELKNELDCKLQNRDKKITNDIFKTFIKSDISNIGMVLSILISFAHQDTIGKMIIHGFLGWIYVFYCFFTNNLF